MTDHMKEGIADTFYTDKTDWEELEQVSQLVQSAQFNKVVYE